MMRRRDLPALVAPVLTGCGRSSLPTVRIALSTGLLEPYLVHLAHALGCFREEGLDVTVHEFAGSRQMESLLGGTSEAVYNSYSGIFLIAGGARRVRSTFVGLETLSSVLVVSAHRAGRIQRIEDLKGTTIGVATYGSAQHQALKVILVRHGVAIDDVTIVAYGNGASAVASLQYGKVDAGMINGSAFHILKRRAPEVRVLVDPRTRKGTRELTGLERWPNFCLLQRADWLEQNPGVAAKLVRAMLRALRWTHEHSAEELFHHLPATLRTSAMEVGIETLRHLMEGTSKDGRMPPDAPAGVLRYVAQTEESVRSANIDLGLTYTNQFVEEAAR